MRQGLGISGALFGTNGARTSRTFFYSFIAMAALVAGVNAINVISLESATHNFAGSLVTEGSSWLSFLLFLWVPWTAWRVAPPKFPLYWKLLLHAPAAVIYSLLHVAGFDLLRFAAFGLMGERYEIGRLSPHFLYEMRKDVLAYALFIGTFSLIDHLLRQQEKAPLEIATFDIRDGAKVTRVRLDEILAVTSAGNYVEFLLEDGRRPLMRSPLQTLEIELAPRGFVRTHRSWLVNTKKVTMLKPEGSGDYTVELGRQSVPLSRRFPDALAKLRNP